MLTFSGKGRAVVFGAASGIGRATAGQLVKCGHEVLLVDRAGGALAEVADDLGGVPFVSCDIRDEVSLASALDPALRDGGCSYVVVTAGIFRPGNFDTVDRSVWQDVLDVNLIGTFNAVRACSHHFRTDGPGAVVTTSSVEASRAVARVDPRPTFAYAASKGAIESITRALALELYRSGYRVNCIAPGPVATAMTQSAHNGPSQLPPGFDDCLIIKRYADPGEVASAALFLLSDQASYITGAILPVDGGYTAL